MLSIYAQSLLRNCPCCHLVELTKGGQKFHGVYNALSNWGRVEDDQGSCVEFVHTEAYDEEENDYVDFVPSNFEDAGYQLVIK